MFHMKEVSQAKEDQIRYTRNGDFTDSVVESFFARKLDESYILKRLSETRYPVLVEPYFGD